MRIPSIALSTAILVLASPMGAQAPPQRDSQALALLTQSMAVNRGASGPVEDTVADGTITWFDGSTGNITLKTKGNERLRTEVSGRGVQTVSVVSNGRGHATRSGTKRDLPVWTTAYHKAIHIPAFSRLGDFARSQMNVLYLGLENVNGLPAHHIRLFSAESGRRPRVAETISDFHLFLDASSLLVVKTLSYDFSPDIVENRTLVETQFDDFRTVGGLVVPHRIVRYIYGQRHMEITLTSVRLNVGLPDSEFQ